MLVIIRQVSLSVFRLWNLDSGWGDWSPRTFATRPPASCEPRLHLVRLGGHASSARVPLVSMRSGAGVSSRSDVRAVTKTNGYGYDNGYGYRQFLTVLGSRTFPDILIRVGQVGFVPSRLLLPARVWRVNIAFYSCLACKHNHLW